MEDFTRDEKISTDGSVFQNGLRSYIFGVEPDSALLTLVIVTIAILSVTVALGPFHGLLIASILVCTAIVGNVITTDGMASIAILKRALQFFAIEKIWKARRKSNLWLFHATRPVGFRNSHSGPDAKRVIPLADSPPPQDNNSKALKDDAREVCSDLPFVDANSGVIYDPKLQRATLIYSLSYATSPFLMGQARRGEVAKAFMRGLDSVHRFSSIGISLNLLDIPNWREIPGVKLTKPHRRKAPNEPDDKGHSEAVVTTYISGVDTLFEGMRLQRSVNKCFLSVSADLQTRSVDEFERKIIAFSHDMREVCNSLTGPIEGVQCGSLKAQQVTNLMAFIAPKIEGSANDDFATLRTFAGERIIYSIFRWPRSKVQPGFFQNIFIQSKTTIAICHSLVPVSTKALLHRTRVQRTNSLANSKMRRARGYLGQSAAIDRQGALYEVERELISGRMGFRIASLVVESASRESQVRASDLFANGGIHLKREFGRQRFHQNQLAHLIQPQGEGRKLYATRSNESWESSKTIANLMPGSAEAPLPVSAPMLGLSRFGGVFSYNPFELYSKKMITSPNMFVFGQIGKGKSALVKSYICKMLASGYSSIVFDPKGEYGSIARHFGFDPVQFVVQGRGINPFINLKDGDEVLLKELNSEVALATLAVLCSRSLTELEESAILQAIDDLEGRLDFHALRHRLIEIDQDNGPTKWIGEYAKGSVARIVASLDLLLAANIVCRVGEKRDMGSLFDQGILVIDLSKLFGTRLYSLAVTLLLSAIRGHQIIKCDGQKVVAIDEIWALLADDRISQWLRSYWKLSRSFGIANLGVTHRLSDFDSTGNGEINSIGAGLLADSETIVGFSMSNAEARAFCKTFELDSNLVPVITGLSRGSAIWKIADRIRLVDHRLTEVEREIFDSDEAMKSQRQT